MVGRQIFEMRTKGVSLAEIARTLNKSNVPTPGGFKRQSGPTQHITEEGAVWNSTKISRILTDERYTGKLIYRKTVRAGTAGFSRKTVPENEWLRIDGTFEPIISDEEFNAVQLMRGHRENNKLKM